MKLLTSEELDRVRRLAGEVRWFVEAHHKEFGVNVYDIDSLEGACAAASYVLADLLHHHGFDAVIAGSSAHFWVEVGGYIVDITATQWPNWHAPPVFIVQMKEDFPRVEWLEFYEDTRSENAVDEGQPARYPHPEYETFLKYWGLRDRLREYVRRLIEKFPKEQPKKKWVPIDETYYPNYWAESQRKEYRP